MDWARAIERNSEALKVIVAALFAMLGLAGDAAVARIPRRLHSAVLRVLRPAESAVRRLIVIAARGLVAKPRSKRPMPVGRVIAKGKAPRPSFQLFDPRKRFAQQRRGTGRSGQPRIRSLASDPTVAALWSRPAPLGQPAPPPDGSIDAASVCRRLAALKRALDDLPRQAKRLARWRAKRETAPSPKFREPLRPGRPPGYRKRPVHDIDAVLAECHGLARDALEPDTS